MQSNDLVRKLVKKIHGSLENEQYFDLSKRYMYNQTTG